MSIYGLQAHMPLGTISFRGHSRVACMAAEWDGTMRGILDGSEDGRRESCNKTASRFGDGLYGQRKVCERSYLS